MATFRHENAYVCLISRSTDGCVMLRWGGAISGIQYFDLFVEVPIFQQVFLMLLPKS